MIDFGCLAHYDHLFSDDVKFANHNDFKFLQLWYDKNGLSLNTEEDKFESIKNCGLPCIIHAVLDINEFDTHIQVLIDILKSLNQKESIIHPVCQSETIDQFTIRKLTQQIKTSTELLRNENIQLYVENNSKVDPILNSINDIRMLFSENIDVELLLDIAHIDDYEHLKEIIKIKQPKILHIADRHLELIHEHLPIGEGNIDFYHIFTNILNDYQGRIILEITQSNTELVRSKEMLKCIINEKKRPTTAST